MQKCDDPLYLYSQNVFRFSTHGALLKKVNVQSTNNIICLFLALPSGFSPGTLVSTELIDNIFYYSLFYF
jgi:hypothetical protein